MKTILKTKLFKRTGLIGLAGILAFSFGSVSASKDLAKAFSKSSDKVVFDYQKNADGTLGAILIGISEKELASQIKKLPKTSKSGLKISSYKYDKAKPSGNNLVVTVDGKAKYKGGFFSTSAKFTVDVTLEVNVSSKKVSVDKAKVTKAKLTKGIPGLNIKDLVQKAVDSTKKPKPESISSILDKMAVYKLKFSGFQVRNGNVFFVAIPLKSIKIDAALGTSLDEFKNGNFNALQKHMSKF